MIKQFGTENEIKLGQMVGSSTPPDPPPDPGPGSPIYAGGGGGAGVPAGFGGDAAPGSDDNGEPGTATTGGQGANRPGTFDGGPGGDLGQPGTPGSSSVGPASSGGAAGSTGANGGVGLAVSGNTRAFWIAVGTITGNVSANIVNTFTYGLDDADREGSTSVSSNEAIPSEITYVNANAWAFYRKPLVRGDFIAKCNVSAASSNRRWWFGVMPIRKAHQFSSTSTPATSGANTFSWNMTATNPGAYL
jgi:hypothetical protein